MHLKAVLLTMALGLCGSTWLAASWYLAAGPLDLLPFTAPGAIIGLAIGWLAHAFSQRSFSWRKGLWCSLTGAVALPPWIAAAVVIVGLTTAGALVMFVLGAWVALAVGGFFALVMLVGEQLEPRRGDKNSRKQRRDRWLLASQARSRTRARLSSYHRGDRSRHTGGAPMKLSSTTLYFFALIMAAACAPAAERGDPAAGGGGLALRSTEAEHRADTTGGELSVRINITATNEGTDSVFLATCGVNTPAHLLERREGDSWSVAIRPACPMILTPPIVIPPGASRTDAFAFQASLAPEGTPGASFPRFEAAVVDGTYRIVYEAFGRGWTIDDSGPSPDARLAEASRASEPFTIRP